MAGTALAQHTRNSDLFVLKPGPPTEFSVLRIRLCPRLLDELHNILRTPNRGTLPNQHGFGKCAVGNHIIELALRDGD